MDELASVTQDDLRAAVERVAARLRAAHRGALGPERSRNLAERVHGVAGNLGALREATRSGWVPCGTVVDGVLGEELRVWLRPRDVRVVAALTLAPEPGPSRFVPKEEALRRWGVR